MNLLSDKIAMLYGVLNNDEAIEGYDKWGMGSHHYCKVNDYSYLNSIKTLHVHMSESTVITPNSILILGTNNDILESIPYHDMEVEEFFQFSTLYDFGNSDYDDIQFVKRHIDALQVLAHKHYIKVKAYMDELYNSYRNAVVDEMRTEIDKDILSKLFSSVSTSKTPPKTLQGMAAQNPKGGTI